MVPPATGTPTTTAHAQAGVGAILALDAVVGDGGIAVAHDRLALAVVRVAGQRGVDRTAGHGHADDDGTVFADDGALVELGHQAMVGGERARDHHQARRALVQAVDDAGPRQRRQARIMVQQAVLQRATVVPRCRVDHQPGGLVDDDQVVVLVDDGEVDRLGGGVDHRIRLLDDGRVEDHRLAARDRRARRRAAAVDAQMAGTQPGLQARARVFGEHRRQRAVQPCTGRGRGDVADIGFAVRHRLSENAPGIGYTRAP